VWMYVCVWVYMYGVYICIMYVLCMYICMYVCMCEYVYVWVCVYTCVWCCPPGDDRTTAWGNFHLYLVSKDGTPVAGSCGKHLHRLRNLASLWRFLGEMSLWDPKITSLCISWSLSLSHQCSFLVPSFIWILIKSCLLPNPNPNKLVLLLAPT